MITRLTSPTLTQTTHPTIFSEAVRLVGSGGTTSERYTQNSLQRATNTSIWEELGLSTGVYQEGGPNIGHVVIWNRFLQGYRTGIYLGSSRDSTDWPAIHGRSLFVPISGCDQLEFKTYSLTPDGRTGWGSVVNSGQVKNHLRITLASQTSLTDTALLTNPLAIDTTAHWVEITNRGHEQAIFFEFYSGAVEQLIGAE